MAGGVELGFAAAADPEDAWRLRSAYFPSKLGGRPAWLGEDGLPGPGALRCARCQQPRAFLLQLYAPLPGRHDTFHRSLFVFACRGAACYRLPGPGGPLCGEPGGWRRCGGRPAARPGPAERRLSPQCSGASCRGGTASTPRSRPPRSPRRAPWLLPGGSAAASACAASAAASGPAPAAAATAPPTAGPSTRRWTGSAGTATPAGRPGMQVGPRRAPSRAGCESAGGPLG